MDFIINQPTENIGNNTMIDNGAEFTNSTILFRGENNILFIEKGVKLSFCSIRFLGSNSLVYIGSSKHKCSFQVNIYNNSVFHMGKNNSVNGRKLLFQLSEQKNIFVGDDNMFSFGISVRVADPHLIYSSKSMERINPSKSVYIGDHVWIGQNTKILKGVNIGSGSILAAESLITKSVPSNVTFGGSPAKVIKKDIFWLRPSVHNFVDKDTEKMKKYEESTYIYNNNDIDLFSKIENDLNSIEDSSQKLNFLLNLNKDKNRFYL